MRLEDREVDSQVQYDREDAAERDRIQRETRRAMVVREAYDAIGAAAEAMLASFTSEPIPGQTSTFYAGGRYYANEEDARRARLDLDEAQWREVERLKAALARRAVAAVWTALGRAG